jgi:hypothetical protein
MTEVVFIPVAKDGEYIEVHPSTLAAHKAIGWRECPKQEPIEDPEGAKKADLQALLDSAA